MKLKHLVMSVLCQCLLIGALVGDLSLLPSMTYAAVVPPTPDTVSCDLPDGRQGHLQSDGRTCCPEVSSTAMQCLFGKYINPVIALLSAAAGLLVTISIIYGAFETITAGSDTGRAAAGRKRIIQALVGLFAYLCLFALLQFLVPGGLV